MAIAEALDCDAKDLIAEAEERRGKQQSQPKPPKDIVVRLEEITNGHELFATLKGAHAGIEDFDTSLDSRHLEEVAFVFDYLRDFGDIQNDLMPSDRIRFAEEVGAKIQALRSDGIICFVGDYNDRLIFKHKPDEPLTWNVGVVLFRRANDGRIQEEKNGKRFIVATIPGKNRTPSF
jgi:hypothetical protein